MTPGQMQRLATRLPTHMAIRWAVALEGAALEFGIDPPERQAMWLAQLMHESAGLTRLVEDTTYTAQRMAQVWPQRFATSSGEPNMLAWALHRKADALANEVYGGRMGNGPPETGDGYRYRGRYPCQLTGREAYTAAHQACGVPNLADPDALLHDIGGMARVSAWVWRWKNLDAPADEGDFGSICLAWNGGSTGLADRIAWHKRAMDALGIA